MPFVKLTLQDGTNMLELHAKIENDVLTGKVSGEIPAAIFMEKVEVKESPKNYKIETDTIHNGTIDLPANLFIPVSSSPIAAVVMICGSGKHIKEEYNGWADMLASKGIAVLTYDKRNVTDFPELNIRQKSSDIVLPGALESDVQAAVELLKKKKGSMQKKSVCWDSAREPYLHPWWLRLTMTLLLLLPSQEIQRPTKFLSSTRR
jgi:hypothetical protein